MIKAIYEKPIANIILHGKRLKALPLRSKTGQECLIFPLLSLSIDDIILYVENAEDFTPTFPTQKNLLELINKLSKVVGYKINRQNSVAFL